MIVTGSSCEDISGWRGGISKSKSQLSWRNGLKFSTLGLLDSLFNSPAISQMICQMETSWVLEEIGKCGLFLHGADRLHAA